MKSIGILGCGWLGFPLAKFLKKKNYSIKVSSTNKDKNSIFKVIINALNSLKALHTDIFGLIKMTPNLLEKC